MVNVRPPRSVLLIAAIALSASLALVISTKPNPTGAASIPVGYECDLFNRTMCFEQISQLGFGCALRQIPNVKVLHRNSSLSKSSKLVNVAVGDGRPSESRGEGQGRILRVPDHR
jgi:hypothetical protein